MANYHWKCDNCKREFIKTYQKESPHYLVGPFHCPICNQIQVNYEKEDQLKKQGFVSGYDFDLEGW
jgi:hypothetical protein